MFSILVLVILSLGFQQVAAERIFGEKGERLGKGQVYQFIFSSDSRLLMVSSGIGIGIYDAHSLEQFASLEGQAAVRPYEFILAPVVLSPDNRKLATINWNSSVSVWSVSERKLLASLEGRSERVNAVAFDREGKRIAYAANDGTILLWDAEKFQPLDSVKVDAVLVLAFTPDGKRLVSGDWLGNIRIWNLEPFQQVAQFRHEGGGNVTELVFSSDGRWLASGGRDWSVRLWDMEQLESKEVAVLWDGIEVSRLMFSPDGQWLAFNTSHPTMGDQIYVWRILSGEEPAVLPGYSYLGFSTDSRILIILAPPEVYRWNLSFPSQSDTLRLEGLGRARPRLSILAKDGQTLAALTEDEQIRVWDLSTGQSHGMATGFTEPITTLKFSSDSRWVATVGSYFQLHKVRLWDVVQRRLVATLQGEEPITGIAFTRDGRSLLVGMHCLVGENCSVYTWDLNSPQDIVLRKDTSLPTGVATVIEDVNSLPLVRQFLERTDGTSVTVESLELSSDGRILALAIGGIILLWDMETRTPLHLLEGHTAGVADMAFSSDGKLLASSAIAGDSQVRLWDIEQGQQVRSVSAPSPPDYSLTFSPDGHRLALGRAAFSPDGKLLAVAGNGIRLWDLRQENSPIFFEPKLSSTTLWDIEQERKVEELDGFEVVTTAVEFSPDGTALAEAKWGGVLVLRDKVSTTSIEDDLAEGTKPMITVLLPNFPNPFNSETVIRYALSQSCLVKLEVFNLAGQQVSRLADGLHASGIYKLRWDGRDENGKALASGVYLYRLEAGTQIKTRKLVLLR